MEDTPPGESNLELARRADLPDDLCRLGDDGVRNRHANRSSRLEIDDEFELVGYPNRQLSWLSAAQYLLHVLRCSPGQLGIVRTVPKEYSECGVPRISSDQASRCWIAFSASWVTRVSG